MLSINMLIIAIVIFNGLNICYAGDNLIKFEDVNVEYVNGNFIDEDSFDLSINYNDNKPNSLRFYVDVIEDLPDPVYIKLTAVGRAFGKYQVPTGVSIDINVCDEKLKKYFLGEILEWIGVTECPPKKGSFGSEDFYPEVPGFASYALPGFHLRIDAELYSPPNLSLLKVKVFMQVS